jgi:hypothetical protein
MILSPLFFSPNILKADRSHALQHNYSIMAQHYASGSGHLTSFAAIYVLKLIQK